MNKRQSTEAYLLHKGTSYKAYEYLGAHRLVGVGYVFRAWAPNADRVMLVGDFCDWSNGVEMRRINPEGIWEVAVSEDQVNVGDKYKYKIFSGDRVAYKADPYAFATEVQPADASLVYQLDSYAWRDSGWLAYRKSEEYHEAINIYQLDLGAWQRYRDGGYATYEMLARELAPYVKQLGYTHISITDAAEYILDGWRTEVYAFFAPSSRFGTPDDFKRFVDAMHEAGIGVFIEFSFSCFPQRALSKFDGMTLYEEKDSPATGFDLSRNEVKSFLASAICFWLEEYHVDGFNLTGMSRLASPVGGVGQYIETISAFNSLYSYINENYFGIIMITDSPAFLRGVSGNEEGDSKFDVVRNLPWTNYTLGYLSKAPKRRDRAYHLTPEMKKIINKNALIAISCENVSGQRNSLIEKMGGDYEQKFAGVRAVLGHMIAYPGYKMTFMGSEFGQFREWSRERELEWFLLDFEFHAKLQLYTAELNNLYLALPALRSGEFEPLECGEDGLFVSKRTKGTDELIIAVNLSDKGYDLIKVDIPQSGVYKEIFNSDHQRFGGNGMLNKNEINMGVSDTSANYIDWSIPPLAISILKCVGRTQEKRKSK